MAYSTNLSINILGQDPAIDLNPTVNAKWISTFTAGTLGQPSSALQTRLSYTNGTASITVAAPTLPNLVIHNNPAFNSQTSATVATNYNVWVTITPWTNADSTIKTPIVFIIPSGGVLSIPSATAQIVSTFTVSIDTGTVIPSGTYVPVDIFNF